MKFLYHPYRIHISIFQLFYSARPIYPLWSDQRQGYQATSITFPVIGRFGSGASACVSWFFKSLHYHPSVNHSSKLAFVLFGIKYNQLWKAELFSSDVCVASTMFLHWALQHKRAQADKLVLLLYPPWCLLDDVANADFDADQMCWPKMLTVKERPLVKFFQYPGIFSVSRGSPRATNNKCHI